MYTITLVFTIHSELGKCNSDELHKIIDSIRPEVIFEELSNDLFDRVYNGDQLPNEPPEIKSIKRYLLNHKVKHIPVDIIDNQDLSINDIKFMFDAFKKYDVYKKMEDEQYKMTVRDGFAFLNSKKCEELIEKKKITERNLMDFMTNKNLLFRIYKLFYEEQDKREYEIIKNIYNYSRENKYNQALLLIGSGHRKSIIEKIEKYKIRQNVELNWTLYAN